MNKLLYKCASLLRLTAAALAFAALAGGAYSATYRATYVDPAGAYVAPSDAKVSRDDAGWTPGNLAFSNASTAGGANVPGEVLVTLSNVTTAGDYRVAALDSSGVWHRLALRHEPESPVTLAMSSYTGIDNRLTAAHGSGLWSAAGSVNVVPFQGSVSYETASFGSDVHIVRGDTVVIPYQAGLDITGMEVWFAAKANPADSSYAIGPVDVTAYVTNPAAGTGLIGLSASDTDVTPRRYLAELELRSPGQVLTPLRFFLWIDPDVIR